MALAPWHIQNPADSDPCLLLLLTEVKFSSIFARLHIGMHSQISIHNTYIARKRTIVLQNPHLAQSCIIFKTKPLCNMCEINPAEKSEWIVHTHHVFRMNQDKLAIELGD